VLHRIGPRACVRIGVWTLWPLEQVSFAATLEFWMAFCATLGLRGPPAFDALAVPSAQMGRAPALMVLLLLGASAALTQATALFRYS
jgi:DHA1 family bicyclomycin/chloramphenicol resistance-like MFS transporter